MLLATTYRNKSALLVPLCFVGGLLLLLSLYTFSRSPTAHNPHSAMMVGGFTQHGDAQNDDHVRTVATFAVEQLKGKVNAPGLELETVYSVEKQVVAGTNYRIKLSVKGSGAGSETYSVVVYEKLPAYGGGMELTSYEKVAEGDAAAQFAAKHVSSMSNSLIPLELQEVVTHEQEGGKHTLVIKVGREGLAATTWSVELETQGNGFSVSKASPAG